MFRLFINLSQLFHHKVHDELTKVVNLDCSLCLRVILCPILGEDISSRVSDASLFLLSRLKLAFENDSNEQV